MLSVICAIIASVICFVIEYIFMPDIFNIWHCICTLIISIPFLDLVLYDIEKISFLKEIEPLIEIEILWKINIKLEKIVLHLMKIKQTDAKY